MPVPGLNALHFDLLVATWMLGSAVHLALMVDVTGSCSQG